MRAPSPRVRQVGPGQVGLIHSALGQVAVQVQKARPRLAEIAGQRGQHRAGAHHVPAGDLALQALTQPEKRRAGRIEVRGFLDQANRDAGRLAQPPEVAGRDGGTQFLPSQHVPRYERLVDQSVPMNHGQQRERERGVASRERLQMKVGLGRRRRADGIDHDHFARRLPQPMLMRMRRRSVGVGSPDDDASRIPGRSRIESVDATSRTGIAVRRGQPCCRWCPG